MKAYAFAALVLLLAFDGNPTPQRTFDYEKDLGVAIAKDGRTCLEIPNDALAGGQIIQFVNATKPQTTGEAKILGIADKECAPTDENKPELHHYLLKVVDGRLNKATPAFALASYTGTLAVTNTGVTADLDGSGRPVSFRSCTTSEGVYLTVWKGEPLKGHLKWSYYYGLGYDVEPTCTERDTDPVSP